MNYKLLKTEAYNQDIAGFFLYTVFSNNLANVFLCPKRLLSELLLFTNLLTQSIRIIFSNLSKIFSLEISLEVTLHKSLNFVLILTAWIVQIVGTFVSCSSSLFLLPDSGK